MQAWTCERVLSQPMLGDAVGLSFRCCRSGAVVPVLSCCRSGAVVPVLSRGDMSGGAVVPVLCYRSSVPVHAGGASVLRCCGAVAPVVSRSVM